MMERLEIHKSQNKVSTRRKGNLYVFLALKVEIAQAIYFGWTARSIWELLTDEKKLTCSYQNFLRLCKGHGITKNELTPEILALMSQLHSEASSTKSMSVTKRNTNVNSGNQEFQYNPNADIKELI